MVTPDIALTAIPEGLRKPLLEEFTHIVNDFMERRWAASELSGGRFCEIVYTILDGHATGAYAAAPTKPSNFVVACRALENNAGIPRSFQILIPRMLPALYEIRNNRNVGHVGSDVNPDFMDSAAVLGMTSWIMAELVRVFHGVSTEEAQTLVDSLAERRVPLVWKSGEIRRVLNPTLSLKDQVLLLLASVAGRVPLERLFMWTDSAKKPYFNKVLRVLHEDRLIEWHKDTAEVEMLPPGMEYAANLLTK